MSILINRFEIREITKAPAKVHIEDKATILIKDHTDDRIISFVHLENDKEKNKELAAIIIEAIENYLESESNEAENQHEEV